VTYIPGTKNVVADCLSRPEADNQFDQNKSYIHSSLISSISEEEEDADSLFDLSFLKNSEEEPLENAVLQDPSKTTMENWPIFAIYILKNLQLPTSLPEMFKKLLKKNKKYMHLKNGKLLRKVTYLGVSYWVPYIGQNQRTQMVTQLHEILGHLGTDSVFDSLRTRGWWPQQLKSLKDLVASCKVCQLNRSNRSSGEPSIPIPPTGLPFYRWSIDFIQDLEPSEKRNSNIIVAVDHATRFVVAEATPDRTAVTVAKFIYKLMLAFGAPKEIVSDRAPVFTGHTLSEYLQIQAINHYPSTPYHPRTNGMVERVNGTLGAMLTKMTLGTREKWDEFVQAAVFNLNARKHDVTGFAPFYLVYGLNPRLPGDTFPPCIFSRSESDISLQTTRELTRLGQNRALALKRSQQNAEAYASTSKDHRTFKIGEFVKLKNYTKLKLQFKWKGPFIIYGIGPHNSYYLKRPDGSELKNPHNGVYLAPWISLTELASSNAELENHQSDNSGGGGTVAS
jgi:transposase InsO family protein